MLQEEVWQHQTAHSEKLTLVSFSIASFSVSSAAAASEAEIRPPSEKSEAVEAKPAPVIRPEDMPPKPKISDNMKQRLRKELTSQGADPNKSAGNPILVVAGIIAVLVIVGGQGIFY